jgi:SulP family sulfate permease
VTGDYIEEGRLHTLQDKHVPPYVSILRIHGPFLFGTTEKLEDATSDLKPFASVVVLRLRNMTALDATGLYALEKLADRLKKSDRTLLLCGAREQPARLLKKAEFIEHVGMANILPHVSAALERARQVNAQHMLAAHGIPA